MNRIVKSGVAAFALAAVAAQTVSAKEEGAPFGMDNPQSYGYTVLAVGIATPIALPWDFNWDVFGLDVNLLYGDCNKMYGLEVAGVANVARLDMYGLQAALAFNYSNRDAYGAQVALFNMRNGSTVGLSVDAIGISQNFYGIAADLLGSDTQDSFYGLNVAGIGNIVHEDMWGWQVALGVTFAKRVHGLQTALLLNMTDDLRGAQIGLINYASTCSAGFQIGLINMIMDNKVPVLPIFNCYF